MKAASSSTQQAAEGLAIQALTFIADGERLGRFLATTGIGPAQIRAAAQQPGFLVGVLEYLAGDERLLQEFAAAAGFDPADVAKALAALGGYWERDIP
jgi:hypothetical protein